MYAQTQTVSLATDSGGAATAYTETVTGLVSQIRYVKNSFDDGSTITVTNDLTGETIWAESSVNASATRCPRAATHRPAGVASLYAGSGTAVNDKIAVANTRIKVVVAGGGNVKLGTLHITLV